MAILCLPVLSAQASPTSDALVIGIQSSKTTSLNPLFPVERDMLSIFDLMYDSLITIDDNYQPQAGLAESWTQTGNGRTWTFTLRQGVLFSVRRGWPGETVRHGLLLRGANIRSRMWHCRRLTVTASQQVSG